MLVETFWNREEEQRRLRRQVGKGGFGYVTGRRRIGKTALLKRVCEASGGLYHQAVEGAPQQQLAHFIEECGHLLPILRQVTPKSWSEFFALLTQEKLPPLMVFDEFPYWVQGDPSLPSFLQKWVDHELTAKKTLLLLSGSSQAMLFSQFLNQSAPLYGRANLHLHLEPMNYAWFCRALKYRKDDPNSFVRYSLVGGVPHYWKLLPRGSPIEQANSLYFEPSALLAEEPVNLLRDEGIVGTLPKAMLDFIGRGVARPSELAGRLGTVQGNLSRPLALLLQLNLVQRELPFGESSRTTKKVLYRINDPALAFFYGVFLPLRSQWAALDAKRKNEFFNQHAARQWELYCRSQYPGSGRYWEGSIEIDVVAPLHDQEYLVAECKWQDLSKAEEAGLLERLKERFYRTSLAGRLKKTVFRIFSKKDL